jgi:hypothetical protein
MTGQNERGFRKAAMASPDWCREALKTIAGLEREIEKCPNHR